MTRLPVVEHLTAGGDRPPLPGLPGRGREDPVARPLAGHPARPPAAPPAEAAGLVGLHPGLGAGHPQAVERPRPRRAGRRPPGQRGRPEADARPAGRAVRRPPGRPARRRAVDRAEGGRLRPGPVGRRGRAPDRVAVARGPRVPPPGPPPPAPQGGHARTSSGRGLDRLAARVAGLRRGPPGQGGRGVGRGRGPARAQADRPPGVGAQGAPADGNGRHEVRVAVRVRVRPPGDRPEPVPDPAEGERRAMGERLAEFAGWADPDGRKVLVRGGGQRRVAHGQEAGGAAERGAAPPAAVHPGVAAGRAAVAAGPGGAGQPSVRPPGRPDRARWRRGASGWPTTRRRSRGRSGSTGPSLLG